MPSDETAESAGAGEAAESAQDQFFKTLQTAVALASSARVAGEQTVGETRTFKGFVAYSDQIELAFTSNVGAGRPLEFRLVDNAVYVRLPGFGRKFFTFDLDDPTLPRGMTAQEFDLSRLLATLQRTTQDVTYVGEERVSDESMDHFRLRLDRAQLLEVLPLDEASPPAPDSATMDLWFDGDGYLRRHDFELGVVGALSLRFDDWGVDVQIEKPTPDQIAGSLFEEG